MLSGVIYKLLRSLMSPFPLDWFTGRINGKKDSEKERGGGNRQWGREKTLPHLWTQKILSWPLGDTLWSVATLPLIQFQLSPALWTSALLFKVKLWNSKLQIPAFSEPGNKQSPSSQTEKDLFPTQFHFTKNAICKCKRNMKMQGSTCYSAF